MLGKKPLILLSKNLNVLKILNQRVVRKGERLMQIGQIKWNNFKLIMNSALKLEYIKVVKSF